MIRFTYDGALFVFTRGTEGSANVVCSSLSSSWLTLCLIRHYNEVCNWLSLCLSKPSYRPFIEQHQESSGSAEILSNIYSVQRVDGDTDPFIREHSTLKSTPAEKANINLKLSQNKLDAIIKQSVLYEKFN